MVDKTFEEQIKRAFYSGAETALELANEQLDKTGLENLDAEYELFRYRKLSA